jgi:6-phosphogluconolactonase
MIEVFADNSTLNTATAERIVAAAGRAVAERGAFHLVLSGGETPKPLYELLATTEWADRLDWRNVHVYWSDERCVPVDDPRSNAGMTRRALLDHVPVPMAQVHPLYLGGSPRQAAMEYEALLRRSASGGLPQFDLALLGLGADGHTASLFPGTSAVAERHRLVCELYLPEQGMHRLTMTLPLLNQARQVVFLVAGAGKASMLQQVLSGAVDSAGEIPPARLVQPDGGELRWMIDAAAASHLHV